MKVAVTWEMCGYVDVPNTNSLAEAMDKFAEECDHIRLPKDGQYVDGSFTLSTDDLDEMACLVK